MLHVVIFCAVGVCTKLHESRCLKNICKYLISGIRYLLVISSLDSRLSKFEVYGEK